MWGFELIGIVTVWLAGAAVAFYVPLLIGLNSAGGGLAGAAFGVFFGKCVLAGYLLLTIAYFIAT